MVYPHMYRTEKSETRTTNATYGDYYLQMQSKKIRIQPPLLKLLQYVDSNRTKIAENLAEAIEIPSVSEDMSYKDDVIRMIHFTENWLKSLSVQYECFNIGKRKIKGETINLLPVILGTLGTDPHKKTLCIYGHLDVASPNLKEWQTDPWKLTEMNNKLYGAGVGLGKGALMCWFQAILACQTANVEIPLNLKFIIECMNTCGSLGLEDFLLTRRQYFLNDVDYVVVCDTEWIGEKHPCLTYGVVGFLHFDLFYEKAEGSKTDIKNDAQLIAKNLICEEGKILIPGIHQCVLQITPDEEKLYSQLLDVNLKECRENLPEYQKEWSDTTLLMHFWRLPSMHIGDIEECICEKQDKSKIKQHVILKIVPLMIPDRAAALLSKYIEELRQKNEIQNKIDVVQMSITRPWFEDIKCVNYTAATRATIQIYKEEPNYIRDDQDLPVVNILHRVMNKSILLLPLANRNSNIGLGNENFLKRNYYSAIKLLCAYLLQLGQLDHQ